MVVYITWTVISSPVLYIYCWKKVKNDRALKSSKVWETYQLSLGYRWCFIPHQRNEKQDSTSNSFWTHLVCIREYTATISRVQPTYPSDPRKWVILKNVLYSEINHQSWFSVLLGGLQMRSVSVPFPSLNLMKFTKGCKIQTHLKKVDRQKPLILLTGSRSSIDLVKCLGQPSNTLPVSGLSLAANTKCEVVAF